MEKQSENVLSYTEITKGIRVTVYPEYLEEDSDPAQDVYAFSYTVAIENYGDQAVQLLRRCWIVNSGGSFYTEVKGEGVVGEQPMLKTAEGFQYTSWSVIKDPIGSMRGSYTFQRTSGELFEVTIPEFDLISPHMLH